jgi:hypothetical protein
MFLIQIRNWTSTLTKIILKNWQFDIIMILKIDFLLKYDLKSFEKIILIICSEKVCICTVESDPEPNPELVECQVGFGSRIQNK